jgi:hypothetical protein
VSNFLEHSEKTLRTHPAEDCNGSYCAIHNRSDHSMRSFRQHWRGDRHLMERICPHGIGHPDPDDYRIVTGLDSGVHGCDGCCDGAYENATEVSIVYEGEHIEAGAEIVLGNGPDHTDTGAGMTHDPLCPRNKTGLDTACRCELITEVREDERRRFDDDGADRDIRTSTVRECIEAVKDELETWSGRVKTVRGLHVALERLQTLQEKP